MSEKICKKCGRPLPKNSKGNKCEHCKIVDNSKIKKATKVLGTVVLTSIGAYLTYKKNDDKF